MLIESFCLTSLTPIFGGILPKYKEVSTSGVTFVNHCTIFKEFCISFAEMMFKIRPKKEEQDLWIFDPKWLLPDTNWIIHARSANEIITCDGKHGSTVQLVSVSLGARLGSFVCPDGETRRPLPVQDGAAVHRSGDEPSSPESARDATPWPASKQSRWYIKTMDCRRMIQFLCCYYSHLSSLTFSIFSEALPLLPGRACPSDLYGNDAPSNHNLVILVYAGIHTV